MLSQPPHPRRVRRCALAGPAFSRVFTIRPAKDIALAFCSSPWPDPARQKMPATALARQCPSLEKSNVILSPYCCSTVSREKPGPVHPPLKAASVEHAAMASIGRPVSHVSFSTRPGKSRCRSLKNGVATRRPPMRWPPMTLTPARSSAAQRKESDTKHGNFKWNSLLATGDFRYSFARQFY